MRQIGSIQNERQLRNVLDDNRRRLDRIDQEDVIVEAPRRLLLRSPNGTFWSVTVNDAGVLSAADVGTSL